MRAETIMCFDQDIHIRTYCIAHRSNDVDSQCTVCALDHAPGRTERIELQRRVAAPNDFLCLVVKTLRLTRTAIPAISIHAQTVMATTADQFINRLTRCLAHDVPAGKFDP